MKRAIIITGIIFILFLIISILLFGSSSFSDDKSKAPKNPSKLNLLKNFLESGHRPVEGRSSAIDTCDPRLLMIGQTDGCGD
jgi:hypothetical protein